MGNHLLSLLVAADRLSYNNRRSVLFTINTMGFWSED
jgi:hypothetical protein